MPRKGLSALAARVAFSLVLLGLWGGSAVRVWALEQEIRALLPRYGLKESNVGIAVVDASGRLAVDIRADKPLKPASNLKVLTTAAAVYWLGLDHAYETTIHSTAPLRAGTIAGDLVVRGTGDPNISGRFYDDDPTALFRVWARKLKAAGLTRVTGDVVADDSFFTGPLLPPTWDRGQESAWYSAPISALNLNDNCLDFTIHPGARPGVEARVTWIPRCPLLKVRGAPQTVSSKVSSVSLHRLAGTGKIVISGKIGKGRPAWRGHVTVPDPALFFVSVLAEVFRDEGIRIEGEARRRKGTEEREVAVGGPPPERSRHLLVQHTSTLLQDLPIINKRSQNLHAEVLLRAMGAKASKEGSHAGGEKAIRDFLEEKRIPADGLAIHDGCGLSHENRVTAALLARVLHSVHREPYFPRYRDSLAVAGEDGTLDDRFQGRSTVRGHLYGKTGYIRGASCLSGYVVRGEGVASFSILVNGMKSLLDAKKFQEKVGEILYRELEPSR